MTRKILAFAALATGIIIPSVSLADDDLHRLLIRGLDGNIYHMLRDDGDDDGGRIGTRFGRDNDDDDGFRRGGRIHFHGDHDDDEGWRSEDDDD